MAADLGVEPWSRLSRLAPPGIGEQRLQEAANRYESTGDLFAGAADLWEEEALQVELTGQTSVEAANPPAVSSVTQDGISVTYAGVGAIDYSQDKRLKQVAAMRSTAAMFRKRAKPVTVSINPDVPDWFDAKDTRNRKGWPEELDEDNGIIGVDW